MKPDEFKSKLDLKNDDLSLIHLPGDAKMVYYSGYGDDKSSGKDIFRIRKKDNNEWGEPENLGNIINTKYDEDFPLI